MAFAYYISRLRPYFQWVPLDASGCPPTLRVSPTPAHRLTRGYAACCVGTRPINGAVIKARQRAPVSFLSRSTRLLSRRTTARRQPIRPHRSLHPLLLPSLVTLARCRVVVAGPTQAPRMELSRREAQAPFEPHANQISIRSTGHPYQIIKGDLYAVERTVYRWDDTIRDWVPVKQLKIDRLCYRRPPEIAEQQREVCGGGI
ncbi:hypothetical protein C8R43DRAFT_1108567 [Mycena crocata]|nr:hypothetical protein C8R43DRAFT_1108567 [Mycena crocata]